MKQEEQEVLKRKAELDTLFKEKARKHDAACRAKNKEKKAAYNKLYYKTARELKEG